MNQRIFNEIYSQLFDSNSKENALFYIRENLPQSIDYFRSQISKEEDAKLKKQAISIYNSTIKEVYPNYIAELLNREYVSLNKILTHYSNYIFNTKSYESETELDVFCTRLINKLDQKIIDKNETLQIINEINNKITKSFIIDDTFLGYYDMSQIQLHRSISQYNISLLILAIAERMDLPIYGIPFEDKIVLCYTFDYCTNYEVAIEDDIKYYIVPGEVDLVYTPYDLELYSAINYEEVKLTNKLPKCNQTLVKSWFDHILAKNFDTKTIDSLSIKYQQIEEATALFDLF